ncbi:MAG: hypothetical protein AAGF74_12285 [Pseudomonadota bacterium]
MKLFTIAKNFINDEDGAVTVDWVVLTSAIVGLGIAVMLSVGNSTANLAGDISQALDAVTIPTYTGP